MFELFLDDKNRILGYQNADIAYSGGPKVDVVPDGFISDWLFVDNHYVYAPLPKPDTDLRAASNYEADTVFTENGELYRATESISTHERIIPGSNCETISLADALNALNKEE